MLVLRRVFIMNQELQPSKSVPLEEARAFSEAAPPAAGGSSELTGTNGPFPRSGMVLV